MMADTDPYRRLAEYHERRVREAREAGGYLRITLAVTVARPDITTDRDLTRADLEDAVADALENVGEIGGVPVCRAQVEGVEPDDDYEPRLTTAEIVGVMGADFMQAELNAMCREFLDVAEAPERGKVLPLADFRRERRGVDPQAGGGSDG